jgi:excisionase family DNA binding protein
MTTPDSPPGYETLSQAAARTQLSVRTIRRLMEDSKIKRYGRGRIVRLDPADVDRALGRNAA